MAAIIIRLARRALENVMNVKTLPKETIVKDVELAVMETQQVLRDVRNVIVICMEINRLAFVIR